VSKEKSMTGAELYQLFEAMPLGERIAFAALLNAPVSTINDRPSTRKMLTVLTQPEPFLIQSLTEYNEDCDKLIHHLEMLGEKSNEAFRLGMDKIIAESTKRKPKSKTVGWIPKLHAERSKTPQPTWEAIFEKFSKVEGFPWTGQASMEQRYNRVIKKYPQLRPN